MKFLSFAQSCAWLLRSDITISSYHDLVFPDDRYGIRKSIFARYAIVEGHYLAELAAAIVNWLPAGDERMLWLKYWETRPKPEWEFFEAIRGTNTHLIDAPGQVFGPDNLMNATEDEDCSGPETSKLSGLTLLVMCYEWDAYLVADGKTDYVYISDGFVLFSSTDEARLRQATELLQSFEMEPKIPSGMAKAGKSTSPVHAIFARFLSRRPRT